MSLRMLILRPRHARVAGVEEGKTSQRRRRTARRVAVLLVGGACAVAPHSLSVLDVQAAPLAATTSVTRQDGGVGGGTPSPGIICDIPSIGDAVGGDAIATTTIVCTGLENELQVTATWYDGNGQILSSDSQDITSPTANYERQDSMNRGTPGTREFKFCMTAFAIGLPSANACNTLTGL